MKTDVRNNFQGNSLTEGNQNNLPSTIFGSNPENEEFPANILNNNCIEKFPGDNISNKCCHNNPHIALDKKKDARDFKTEIYGNSNSQSTETRFNCLPRGVKAKTSQLSVPRRKSSLTETTKSVRNNNTIGTCKSNPSKRRVSDFGIFNPCFKEQEDQKKCSRNIDSYDICKRAYNKSDANIQNMPVFNSRKSVLNDAIANALSGSDQLINLRELSNAISYNRKFDSCNCQSLYEELMFPCNKPETENVIKNSCAKESHFVLGFPKKKPNFSIEIPPEIKVDDTCCKPESKCDSFTENYPKNKYILPIPQSNEKITSVSESDKLNTNQSEDAKDDNSDNFDKSEYMKFKQIACSRDDFKLKIFFDEINKKRPPTLQNRSSSFPQTEEIVEETNPDGSLRSPGRKYSHPTMTFQSVMKDDYKNESLPIPKEELNEILTLKPIPQYACNIVKPESLMEAQDIALKHEIPKIKETEQLFYQNSSAKTASKRRLEFRSRRGSAPVTDVRIENDDESSLLALPIYSQLPAEICQPHRTSYSRRSTIGPETMSYDLRHMSKINDPGNQFELMSFSCADKDATNLLKTRSKLLCDGFRSLDQMSSIATSLDSSTDSDSSDSSSNSSSFTSSSSWSLSSSSSSDSSD